MRISLPVAVGASFYVVVPIASSQSKAIQASYPTKSYDKAMVCSSHVGEAIKNLEAKLETLLTLMNKNSTPPSPESAVSSCKELFDRHGSLRSQVFMLMFGSQGIPVYCHTGNFGCGDGGWTLAMKIDGTKRTFHYNSRLWSDRNSYNLPGGKTGFDRQETKLPTYWNTPFSRICLRMRIGHQIKFTVINKPANSLYSLIADGRYLSTSKGRHSWKKLIGSQGSLQLDCNKEGFNAVCSSSYHSRARIGFLANNGNDCSNCDSRIGFGTGGYPDDSNTCGNVARLFFRQWRQVHHYHGIHIGQVKRKLNYL